MGTFRAVLWVVHRIADKLRHPQGSDTAGRVTVFGRGLALTGSRQGSWTLLLRLRAVLGNCGRERRPRGGILASVCQHVIPALGDDLILEATLLPPDCKVFEGTEEVISDEHGSRHFVQSLRALWE